MSRRPACVPDVRQRSTSAPTASIWSSPSTATGSWWSSTACANPRSWPPAWTRRAGCIPREEQQLLACLVGAHRRKLALEPLEGIAAAMDGRGLYLILILRLAVLLHRDRSDAPVPRFTLVGRPRSLDLRLRSLRGHPLTAADLNDEIDYLRAQGLRLRVLTSSTEGIRWNAYRFCRH